MHSSIHSSLSVSLSISVSLLLLVLPLLWCAIAIALVCYWWCAIAIDGVGQFYMFAFGWAILFLEAKSTVLPKKVVEVCMVPIEVQWLTCTVLFGVGV